MILAAAIKFHINKTDSDVVLCGYRHNDIFLQLKLLGFMPRIGYKEIAQGFIDDKNNFLTREEAYDHAIKCGQIEKNREPRKPGDICGRLVSEDLY